MPRAPLRSRPDPLWIGPSEFSGRVGRLAASGQLRDPRGRDNTIVPGTFLLLAVLGGAFGYLQYVAIVIYLSSLANVVYRGWHDRAAGTIVLSRPRGSRS